MPLVAVDGRCSSTGAGHASKWNKTDWFYLIWVDRRSTAQRSEGESQSFWPCFMKGVDLTRRKKTSNRDGWWGRTNLWCFPYYAFDDFLFNPVFLFSKSRWGRVLNWRLARLLPSKEAQPVTLWSVRWITQFFPYRPLSKHCKQPHQHIQLVPN